MSRNQNQIVKELTAAISRVLEPHVRSRSLSPGDRMRAIATLLGAALAIAEGMGMSSHHARRLVATLVGERERDERVSS